MHITLKNTACAINEQRKPATKVVEEALSKIEKTSHLNAYLEVFSDSALERAKIIDEKIKQGEKQGLLAGIPIAVKDTIVTKEGKTTCGSKMLETFESIYQATVLERMEKQGAIVIGKTNTDEFAMGSSTETSAFGNTLNPLDKTKIPGGSSGGSASAVGAKTVLAALGSDTGGSIRQPAACCGVVGVKPTYGRVSRYGLVAFASSLDQIGTIAQSVEDAAYLLNVISGKDSKDQTSSHELVPDFTQDLTQSIVGKKIGFVKECFNENVDVNIRKAVEKSLKECEKKGAILKEVSLKHLDYGVATYYVIAAAEASSNLSRYDGVRYTQRALDTQDLNEMYTKTRSTYFGEEVKRRILLGTYVLSSGFYSAYYLQAQKMRARITQDFQEAFKDVDVIAMPTMAEFPAKLGSFDGDPLKAYLQDVFTVGSNLAGLPAISVPIESTQNLPTAIQFVAPAFQEQRLFQIASAIEMKV